MDDFGVPTILRNPHMLNKERVSHLWPQFGLAWGDPGEKKCRKTNFHLAPTEIGTQQVWFWKLEFGYWIFRQTHMYLRRNKLRFSFFGFDSQGKCKIGWTIPLWSRIATSAFSLWLIHLCIHPSIAPSMHPSIHPSTCPSIHPSVYMSTHTPKYLSSCVSLLNFFVFSLKIFHAIKHVQYNPMCIYV